MRSYFKYILLASAVFMAAVGCNKTLQPAYELTDSPIMLSATEAGTGNPLKKGTIPATKALLDADSFAAEDNLIKIYDIYTQAGSSNPETDPYIDDQIKSEGPNSVVWPFVNQRYNWTADGSHKFFGWFVKDVNLDPKKTVTDYFQNGFSYDETNKILSTGSLALTSASPQFDFMYSNIYVRDLNTEPNYVDPVELEFSHLFTAFGVTAVNESNGPIILESVTIKGLSNSKSATINYAGSGSNPVVSYNNAQNTGAEFTYPKSISLTKDVTVDVSSDYLLMWPQTSEDFKTAEIIVEYQYANEDGKMVPTSKTVPLSSLTAWDAGVKNSIDLKFIDKKLELICTVQPWQKETEEIDYAQQTVTVSKKISWEGVQDVDYKTGHVILKSDKNAVATCTFRIDTPVGATWTASLILANEDGSVDAFSWVDDTKYGIVGTGKDSVIKLKVNNNAPIAPQHICILRITVQTSDMRTIVVNDLVPEKYTDEHGIEHVISGYTEFQIVQNNILG